MCETEGMEKMKEVKHYVCETCGTEYNNKANCESCEKGHHKPVGINGANWSPMKNDGSGYPAKVHIRMSNGEVITYKRY